ncbi:MAG: nicotinate phosphoribosyltransferase [Acidimicrobiia bacterium]
MRPVDAPLLGGILATDQYQLTMAEAYWRDGLADRPAMFDFFFRSLPDYGSHQAGYAVLAGLGWFVRWLDTVRVTDADIEYLATQATPAGDPRFEPAFLDWLSDAGGFGALTVTGVPEGRVVHPNTPLLTVEGPLALAQLVETPLLNALNYPTLVATKASRVVDATGGAPVLEFGMRRGPEAGADAGARAALIGGCTATSNVALSATVGVPPAGTHAHSFVQAHLALGHGEVEAFRAYAATHPDECLLLVDTIDTLTSGVPNAITVFSELRAAGHEPLGVRLDSGDLANLAVQTARMLDDAGFEDTSIVLSGDLDELVIWQIRSQVREEAPALGLDPDAVDGRLTYGVGTRLITSHGAPSLNGVYKLVAVADAGGRWHPAVKVSEDPRKVPAPGRKRLVRLRDRRGRATADVVALVEEPASPEAWDLRHPYEDVGRTLAADEVSDVEDLHVELFGPDGRRVGDESIEELADRRRADLDRLDPGVRRIVNPHRYHVSYTKELRDLRDRLVGELE